MIHPMWHEYAKAFSPVVWSSVNVMPDESPGECRARMAKRIGEMADLMCAEYDKRDKAQGGSPYR